jgi:ABC-2 type transport system permease protein
LSASSGIIVVAIAVARKERLETRRDRRLWLGFLAVMVLLLTALAGGVAAQRSVQRERADAERADRESWLGQGRQNPHSAAHFGRYLFRPVSPLFFVDPGVDLHLGMAERVEAHRRNPPRTRRTENATVLARFGDLTAAAILQLFVPFLLVLFLFSSFAGEWESGTSRLLLSLGIPWRGVVLGKIAGTSAALFVPLCAVAGLGALAIVVSSFSQDWPEIVARTTLLGVAYAIYFAAFAFVCLAVSARSSTSRLALVILLAFLCAATLIAPRLAAEIAERAYPVPEIQQFIMAMRRDFAEGIDGHNPTQARADAAKQRVLAEYGVSRIEDLPMNFDGLLLQEGERYGDAVIDRHFGALWRQYDGQRRMRMRFGVFTPALSLRDWSMAFASTDLTTYQVFADQAETYRRTLVRFLNGYLATHGPRGDWTWKAETDLWARAPEFVWTPRQLGDVIRAEGMHLTVLMLWLIVSGLAAATAPSKEPGA